MHQARHRSTLNGGPQILLEGDQPLLGANADAVFVYRIAGINNSNAEQIPTIQTDNVIQRLIQNLLYSGAMITFDKVEGQTFEENLTLIDSYLPRIVGELLLISYSRDINPINELVSILEQQNPLSYRRQGTYEYKIKKFLYALLFGMVPERPWNGNENIKGAIVVKHDAVEFLYSPYNRGEFEQYLFDNTYLERPSTSRHRFATVYEDRGEFYMKLNLQIRFKEESTGLE